MLGRRLVGQLALTIKEQISRWSEYTKLVFHELGAFVERITDIGLNHHIVIMHVLLDLAVAEDRFFHQITIGTPGGVVIEENGFACRFSTGKFRVHLVEAMHALKHGFRVATAGNRCAATTHTELDGLQDIPATLHGANEGQHAPDDQEDTESFP